MTNETTASERETLRDELVAAYMQACKGRDADHNEVGYPYFLAGWSARAALPAPADQVLVPKRLTRAMREVLDEEGWTWEDLLAAAEAITEAEYAELQAAPADQPPSQEPQGSSGSLSESGVEARTQVAASASERLPELLRWCYSKLHYRSFDSMEDALVLDEIKLLLEHGKGAQA